MIINTRDVAKQVQMQFTPAIWYGQVLVWSAWTVYTAMGKANITDVAIFGGRIGVTHDGMVPALEIHFQGPPPLFRGVDRGILESFQSPVPFP